MEKISNLLLRLSRRLYTNAEQQEEFIHALISPQNYNSSILWCQPKPSDCLLNEVERLAWQPQFVDRLELNSKPGQDDLHAQGYFYCLDFSSVFAASIFLNIHQPINTIFDMCAAPGGKSIFAWKLLQPQLLIANEVIGKRLGMLIANFKRCHIQPVAVLNRDSSIFAETIPKSINLVIVDAPCSGQSLLAKGEKVPGCFHPTNINKNANRQKRIIANSAQIVAPQGYLAYMTCTYSPEENEDVCKWLLERFPQFQPVVVSHLEKMRSHLTDIPCYRMFPQSGLGAGAFAALFQNTETNTDIEAVKEVNREVLQELGIRYYA
ncbi:RsmB/NOP family class I SAM-dependent RNA methyltransferase [Calothrix sp. UHCC 0171]|uniref:RsmB/NOP family class I SAM-dependent RNA methyltransferase n=1 Tax=Calothrix sp. UHCC 0171 TaxID=3110245 RepID=UPI002B21554E|nr:RsmB/NOP family class I SAM-dependent RNA methyltransferase [Calothrix sp. UHCC 0171]MEA5574467.1 RsmB/NOP family class I SAM-dependent RNA methyltransferase [Calothrix sp. UHCC 0171]